MSPDKTITGRPAWTARLKPEDLPEEWQGLADQIGLENTLDVLAYFAGSEPYIPRFDGTIFHPPRQRIMKERWNELKSQQATGIANKIALEFDVQARHVRQFFADQMNDCEEQEELF